MINVCPGAATIRDDSGAARAHAGRVPVLRQDDVLPRPRRCSGTRP